VLALLAYLPRSIDVESANRAVASTRGLDLRLNDAPKAPAKPAVDGPRANSVLKSAAKLCTEFSRVKDLGDLNTLLGEAATLMEASGLIVWVGSATGADLRPIMAHGYPPQTLARMPLVSRGADNAAAAAYRTGRLQIVLAHPGSASGAIVAPMLAPEGCIGALAAEIKSGGEASDSVQACASIIAAQLAGVLAPAATAEPQAAARAANS
jgi:hypothetical protein